MWLSYCKIVGDPITPNAPVELNLKPGAAPRQPLQYLERWIADEKADIGNIDANDPIRRDRQHVQPIEALSRLLNHSGRAKQ